MYVTGIKMYIDTISIEMDFATERFVEGKGVSITHLIFNRDDYTYMTVYSFGDYFTIRD